MTSCEKCWDDAFRLSYSTGRDQSECYHQLLEERKDNPCIPEQQAGRYAEICSVCNRKTLHQVTGQCMNRDCPQYLKKGAK